MNRPAAEVADIIRAQGHQFLKKYESSINIQQRKAFRAIRNCRTAALGHHIDICPKCGHKAESFNSCRNRSCPKCQAGLRRRWIAAREREVLAVAYFHVVFTVPRRLKQLALRNQRLFYNLLFKASKDTLLEVAANPRYLGAKIGILAALHTWGQTLNLHPHIHCLIPQGGIAPDQKSWIHGRGEYFLPKDVLKKVFRGKLISGLRQLHEKKKLNLTGALSHLKDPTQFAKFIRELHYHKWVVDIRPPLDNPDKVIEYLGRYTHRVAISNHRILKFDGQNVTFLWKDYRQGGKKRQMTLKAIDFLQRFFLHVLPKGFVRIRSFGFMANRFRAEYLSLCRKLLSMNTQEIDQQDPTELPEASAWLCPHCGTRMIVVQRFRPGQWCSRGGFINN